MQVSIQNVSKQYQRGSCALKGINLEIGSGLFGLLGPNGAGKTTLMNILVTLLNPSSGEVIINGYDLRKQKAKIRSLVGYLPQEMGVFPKLKAWEFLDYSARLAGIHHSVERKIIVNSFLERIRFSEERNRFCSELSGGMKRRLGIAHALIGSPRLLVVDEPTAGLDPEERLHFRNLLAELGNEEVAIILSTHIVGDISSTCSDMAMLHNGAVVFHGKPAELIGYVRGHAWKVTVSQAELYNLKNRYPVVTSTFSNGEWEAEIVGENLEGYSGIPAEPNMENAYIYYLDIYGNASI